MMTWFKNRLEREGPTDVPALLRIGLALLMWTRLGVPTAPYYVLDSDQWLLALVFFPATTAMLFGFWSRTATVLTAVCCWVMWLYFVPEHGRSTYNHHHTRLMFACVTWLSFAPVGHSWSVDRWLAVRRAERLGKPKPSTHGPLWAVDLVAIQIGTIYFWSAWDKTTMAFLSGERLEILMVRFHFFDYPRWPGFHALAVMAAWTTVVVEYTFPFLLFIKRLQPLLFAIAFVLHGLFFILLPVSTFTCTMYILYLAFLGPEVIPNLMRRITDFDPEAHTAA